MPGRLTVIVSLYKSVDCATKELVLVLLQKDRFWRNPLTLKEMPAVASTGLPFAAV